MATKTEEIRIDESVEHITHKDIKWFCEEFCEISIGSLPEYILQAAKDLVRKEYFSWSGGSMVPDLRTLGVDVKTVDSIQNATDMDKLLIAHTASVALHVGASTEPEPYDNDGEEEVFYLLEDEILAGDWDYLESNEYTIHLDPEEWEEIEKGEYEYNAK